jgi:group II intron reverse transcriptase/maturase
MQKAELVLTMLYQKSNKERSFKFKRIYRNLFNRDFYLKAYSKISGKKGNMTRGINNDTIDGFNIKKIETIIKKLRKEQFYPTPVRRTYIPKKNGKLRPLGVPSFTDKLVQEVIRLILEAIYEPLFAKDSHGFRPNKSCHTALTQVKSCNGTNWIIEGDITGFFDNINHETLIEILKQKIDDGRLIEIIRRFLKAGYLEQGIKRNAITGTPQGGIISPILANIYLNELDKYIESLKTAKGKGNARRRNKEYHNKASVKRYYVKKGNRQKVRELTLQLRKMQSRDMFDPEYQRLRYTRYADDFVICINGSKKFAEEIKTDVNGFLKGKLKLELNHEKTVITNMLKDRVRFLGYDIVKAKDDTRLTKQGNIPKRSVNGILQLLVPNKIISEKIKGFTKNGKSKHINDRINIPIHENISIYNAEIRGLCNYYKLANNVSQQIYRFKYYHYYSLLKTIAVKERTRVRKIIKKYGINVPRKDGTGTLKVLGIRYKTSSREEKILTYFNDSIKKYKSPILQDNYQTDIKESRRCEIIKRLKKSKCELCGEQKILNNLEVHHIRKLKNLAKQNKDKNNPEKKWINTMIKMKRKTLILCEECHNKIHKENIVNE